MARVLDAVPHGESGLRPDAGLDASSSPVGGELVVPDVVAQRSALSLPAAAGVTNGPPAGGQAPPAEWADAGAVAVARGLARRDADGSVVFGEWGVVQRQEATGAGDASDPAGAGDGPEPDSAGSPAGGEAGGVMTAGVSAGASSGAPAAQPASGAAGLSLDELARQLFDPLAARLKAELRLDRERAGLLTDLR